MVPCDCWCYMTLPHVAVGLSSVHNCGIFLPYSFSFLNSNKTVPLNKRHQNRLTDCNNGFYLCIMKEHNMFYLRFTSVLEDLIRNKNSITVCIFTIKRISHTETFFVFILVFIVMSSLNIISYLILPFLLCTVVVVVLSFSR